MSRQARRISTPISCSARRRRPTKVDVALWSLPIRCPAPTARSSVARRTGGHSRSPACLCTTELRFGFRGIPAPARPRLLPHHVVDVLLQRQRDLVLEVLLGAGGLSRHRNARAPCAPRFARRRPERLAAGDVLVVAGCDQSRTTLGEWTHRNGPRYESPPRSLIGPGRAMREPVTACSSMWGVPC